MRLVAAAHIISGVRLLKIQLLLELLLLKLCLELPLLLKLRLCVSALA